MPAYQLITAVCTIALLLPLFWQASWQIAAVAVLLATIILFAQQRLWAQQQTQHRRSRLLRHLGKRQVHQKRLQTRDEYLALKILNHIVQPSGQPVRHAQIWQKPLHRFSGDLAIACVSPCGKSYTLLADLTGHGIAAAMGATPVASVFQATAKQGLPVAEIIRELNSKLTEILPAGFFCCAAVIRTDQKNVTICNAGLPDLLIVGDSGDIIDRVPSTELPLGIQDFTDNVKVFSKQYQKPHSLYAFTDGLIEAPGANDEYFDLDHLERVISSETVTDGRLEGIKQRFESFVKGTHVNDDISIVEVRIC